MRTYKIAVFTPESGTNFQSILDAMDRRGFQSKVLLCHSSKEDAYGLERTEKHGIDCLVSEDDDKILQALKSRGTNLIVLVGYSRILDGYFLRGFKGLTLNAHLSLLPKYGGMRVCRVHVHETVYACRGKESGAIVHLAAGMMDGGQIILREPTGIEDCHGLEKVRAKVLKVEHRLLSKAIAYLEEV